MSTSKSRSIAVFGAGPGLGQAVARRYAREGYAVVLVGRRQEPLHQFANELASAGATAHVITADLSRTDAIPQLAERIRAKVGNLDAFYYAPTPAPTPGMDDAFVPATNLTPQRAQDFMPLAVYTLLALVRSGRVRAWLIRAPAAAVRQAVSQPWSASTAAGVPVVALRTA